MEVSDRPVALEEVNGCLVLCEQCVWRVHVACGGEEGSIVAHNGGSFAL